MVQIEAMREVATTSAAGIETSEAIAIAESLVDRIREAAPETERLRAIEPATFDAIEQSGLLSLLVPTERGGMAAKLEAFIEVARVLATGDLSTAWSTCFLIEHAWMASRFPKAAQDEMFAGAPYVKAASSANPPGRATAVDGGVLVSGRWSYLSAVMHSDWLLLAAELEGDDGRRVFIAVPKSELEIHRVWSMTGMAGTGSHDASAERLFVPEHRVIDHATFASVDNAGASLSDYPLLRFPVHRVLSLMSFGFLVGAGERVAELFAEALPGRVRAYGAGPHQDAPVIHATFGQAANKISVARTLMADVARRTEATYSVGATMSLEDRAYSNMNAVWGSLLAADAVQELTRLSGSGIHRAGQAIDRYMRDVEVMRNHPTKDWGLVSETAGRVLLGRGLAPTRDSYF